MLVSPICDIGEATPLCVRDGTSVASLGSSLNDGFNRAPVDDANPVTVEAPSEINEGVVKLLPPPAPPPAPPLPSIAWKFNNWRSWVVCAKKKIKDTAAAAAAAATSGGSGAMAVAVPLHGGM
ncbi:hypothetical protein TcWFU_009994 [Taenia crassiceps]|uniref:Uncharacterized protein n=1 Tax=Taenia crassiceps TaxID=6207 RepID=A0ABR4Q461_9CEST